MISLNLLLIIKNIKKIAKIFPVKKIQVFNDEIVIFIKNLMLRLYELISFSWM